MLQIITIPVTPYQQNARILIDSISKKAVIVDPGGDVPQILAALPQDVALTAIWITHSHIDHVSGVAALLAEFDSGQLDVIAHSDDKINREHLPMQSQMMQFPYSGEFDTTQDCGHEDVLSLGQYDFKVLHTPGHAIGHVSFYCEDDTNQYHAPLALQVMLYLRGVLAELICRVVIINNYWIVFKHTCLHCLEQQWFAVGMGQTQPLKTKKIPTHFFNCYMTDT